MEAPNARPKPLQKTKMRTFKLHTQKPIIQKMKTHTHTPSPWSAYIDVHPNDSNLSDIRILEPSTASESLTANTIAVLNQNMGNEAIANARLISACPDMFEALQAICDAFGDQDSLLIDQCKAAIAKAEWRAE